MRSVILIQQKIYQRAMSISFLIIIKITSKLRDSLLGIVEELDSLNLDDNEDT